MSDGPLKTTFANMATKKPKDTAKKADSGLLSAGNIDLPDIDDVLSSGPAGTSKPKKLSVERIYQKKTQLEHILLRPDTYIGSVEKTTQPMWVYEEEGECMVQREITFVPGLYKIFDEILVNAADNKQRDPKGMTTIKIDIDPENNKIKIWNNGKGIPVVEHAKEKVYVPTLIFGHLLTSSNYDDSEKKVTGGRNGYGAKLCNIFSKKFIIETQASEYRQSFRQVWTDNMTKTSEPKISSAKGEDYTCVTFHPDLSKFKMETLDKDVVDLFNRRAYDIAASSRGVKVFLNGKRLNIKNFKDYVELYTKDKYDDNNQPLKIVYEAANDRWEVAVTMSEKGFQQVSFVNSIATTKGGKHVDYITDMIVTNLIEVIKKKEKKAGITIKPFQVKNHVWVFVNALIENPTFDSQTKENMTLQAKSFGSKCTLTEKFYTAASKCGIVEAIQTWMRFKQQTQLNQKCSGAKRSKLRGIPKLDDANDAGTKNSIDCTLILTEGDSAKTLAVAGLGVVGRDRYGVFPLRGKVLNVREAAHKQIMENAEINNIIKIIGLQYKQKYDTRESLQTLRYGRLMIMTDQDQDGSHIKGLLINFIHHNWPNLLQHRFVEEFITPIVKVSKAKQEKPFYSLPEFEEWKAATENWHTWKVKYYKGLGTSTAKEAKEYFSDMMRHRIPFKYAGPEDDAAIVLAFSKKKIEERKEWLTNWMEERKRRALIGLQELYLYGKDTKQISYNEFVNRELILYSNMDNERSIPSLVDGFKPGQRKVLFTCMKRNLVKELKVAQLAGSVAELSAYHHGEQSLMATIIGLAQNFVGSNNLNLLLPIGQFGTRLNGGKDSASPRYIFTQLSPLTRHIFNVHDDPLLRNLRDDNVKIEPEWYIPIIPMVLVNGSEGIGTGWSTKIPNYDIREIVENLRLLIDGREPVPMLPSFKNFKGTIEQLDDQRFVTNGEVSVIDNQTIEITELPIRVWTQTYKESVLEPMLQGTDKVPAFITDYKEYHTDVTVRFVVKLSTENLAKAEAQGLHRVFKLQTTLTTTSMVLFDAAGCIRRFDNVEEILREFYTLRLDYYKKRKDFLEGMLAAESLKLDNQARFICEKIDKIVYIENIPKKEIIQLLVRRGYDSDPVKAWREVQAKLQALEANNDSGEEGDENEESNKGPDFNYILQMQLWCLTKERKDELLKQRDTKADELHKLKRKSPTDLWKDDLNAFIEELEKVEKQEKEDEMIGLTNAGGKGKAKPKKVLAIETRPSPAGRRVVPTTDALRNKFEAIKNANKKKKTKKEGEDVDDGAEGFDDSDIKSLADRVGFSSEKPAKPKKERKPREKKPPGEKKEKASGGSAKKGTGSPKKGKKKNPWSDSEDDKSMGSDVSDVELETSFSNDLIEREKGPRRAAVSKAKYTFSDDEKSNASNKDDDEDEVKSIDHEMHDNFQQEIVSDNESDASFGASNKPKAAPAKKSEKLSFDTDSDDYVPESPKPKKTAAPKEKAKPKTEVVKKQPAPSKPAPSKAAPSKAAPSSPINIDSDSQDLDDSPKPKKAAPSKKRAQKNHFDNDDENIDDFSEDEFVPKKKAPAPKKAKAADSGDKLPKPKKAAAPKKKKAMDSDASDEDAYSKPKPKKAAAPKRKKVMDSDASSDDGMAAKKSKNKKDSDNEFNLDEINVPLRERVGRAKAPVQYKFGESDDDDDF